MAISKWEYHQIRDKLTKEGKDSINDAELLQAITAQRTRVKDATAKTKKARRQAQGRKRHEKKMTPAKAEEISNPNKSEAPSPFSNELILGDIQSDFGSIQ